MTVSEVAERVEERFKPVRERVTRSRETPAERLKGTVESATERLAEQARERKESVAEMIGRGRVSRAPTERVGDFVSERLESETTRTWSARMALLGAGFLLGFLLGWLARAGRGGENHTDIPPEEHAQPPAGMPRGSTLES